MLVSVTFAYVDGALWEEKFQEKKALCPLYLLLPVLRVVLGQLQIEHADANCL